MRIEYEQLRQHWLVACTTRMLGKRPLGVTILGTPLVLFRSGEAVIAAEDRCPHRNAPLSHGSVEAGRIRCPYHAWCFDADGRCVAAPGLSADHLPAVSLRRWRAQETAGLIWVAPWNTSVERRFYRPKLANDHDYRGFTTPADVEATLPDALENLLDGTHTPFVHAGLVRGGRSKHTFTATVCRQDEFVEAEYRGEPGQSGLISRWFEPEREASFGRFIPPCTAELEYRSRRRIELLVAAHFTPTTTGRLRVFITCHLPGGLVPAAVKYAVVRPFFRRVLAQDCRMLRLQQQNVLRFSGPAYTYWAADLLRPWIDAWLRDGRFPGQPDGPQTIRFSL